MYNASWAEVTPDINTLYNYAISYCKGAGVLHMLRYTIGDSLFFTFLNEYATDTANFKNKTAVTDDLTAKLNQVAGQDLTWFIDQWVKQPNHPVYQNTYNFTEMDGNDWQVSFTAKQIQTNTPFHKMPIQVKITFTDNSDTTIRVINDVNNQSFSWIFANQPSNFTFDPDNNIVLKTATTAIGIPEETQVPFEYALYQNYPNPFNPVTKINFDLPEKSNVVLKIYNVLGELVAVPVNDVRSTGRYTVEFDGKNLPSGVYYYELNAGSFKDSKKMILVK
jgi:hypothetical protein